MTGSQSASSTLSPAPSSDRSSRWSLSAFLLGVDNKLPDFSSLIGSFSERAGQWLAPPTTWVRGTAIDRSLVTWAMFWPVVGGPCLVQFDTAYLDVKRSACLEMLDSRENFCQFEGVCPWTTTWYHHPVGTVYGVVPNLGSLFSSMTTSAIEQCCYGRQFEYLNNCQNTKTCRSLRQKYGSRVLMQLLADEIVPNCMRFRR